MFQGSSILPPALICKNRYSPAPVLGLPQLIYSLFIRACFQEHLALLLCFVQNELGQLVSPWPSLGLINKSLSKSSDDKSSQSSTIFYTLEAVDAAELDRTSNAPLCCLISRGSIKLWSSCPPAPDPGYLEMHST